MVCTLSKMPRLSDKGVSTSKTTVNMIRCLDILLQVWDLLFTRARIAASSLEMYCNLFSKSSPFSLKIPFQRREMIPLRFFSTALESFFSLSVMHLSSAISYFALLPSAKVKKKLSIYKLVMQLNKIQITINIRTKQENPSDMIIKLMATSDITTVNYLWVRNDQ